MAQEIEQKAKAYADEFELPIKSQQYGCLKTGFTAGYTSAHSELREENARLRDAIEEIERIVKDEGEINGIRIKQIKDVLYLLN